MCVFHPSLIFPILDHLGSHLFKEKGSHLMVIAKWIEELRFMVGRGPYSVTPTTRPCMFVASLLPPVTATEISDLQFQFRSRRIIGETYDLFQTEHSHKLRYELVLHQASVSHYKFYCQVNCRFLQLYCLFFKASILKSSILCHILLRYWALNVFVCGWKVWHNVRSCRPTITMSLHNGNLGGHNSTNLTLNI